MYSIDTSMASPSYHIDVFLPEDEPLQFSAMNYSDWDPYCAFNQSSEPEVTHTNFNHDNITASPHPSPEAVVSPSFGATLDSVSLQSSVFSSCCDVSHLASQSSDFEPHSHNDEFSHAFTPFRDTTKLGLKLGHLAKNLSSMASSSKFGNHSTQRYTNSNAGIGFGVDHTLTDFGLGISLIDEEKLSHRPQLRRGNRFELAGTMCDQAPSENFDFSANHDNWLDDFEKSAQHQNEQHDQKSCPQELFHHSTKPIVNDGSISTTSIPLSPPLSPYCDEPYQKHQFQHDLDSNEDTSQDEASMMSPKSTPIVQSQNFHTCSANSPQQQQSPISPSPAPLTKEQQILKHSSSFVVSIPYQKLTHIKYIQQHHPQITSKHTVSKPISCTHCDKLFDKVLDYAHHVDTFNLVGLNKCPDKSCVFHRVCFMRKVDLRIHIVQSHMHEYNSESYEVKQRIIKSNPTLFREFINLTYNCEETNCARVFYRKDSLTRHNKLVHPESYSKKRQQSQKKEVAPYGVEESQSFENGKRKMADCKRQRRKKFKQSDCF